MKSIKAVYQSLFFMRFGLFTLLYCLTIASPRAAPITFNSALPVSQNEWVLRGLASFESSSSTINDKQLEREELSLTSVVAYGISAKWAAIAVLPLSNINQTSVDSNIDESGFGDAELFGRYEAYRTDKLGATKRIAPFAGLRLATGERGVISNGTAGVFAGVTFTRASIKQTFDLQIRYDHNTSNGNFNAGDVLTADFSWQRRVAPKIISANTKGFWLAVLETNLNLLERNRLAGDLNPNSGGFNASILPGIQYLTRRWIAELAVRVPIIKQANGNALESDYAIITGIRANF